MAPSIEVSSSSGLATAFWAASARGARRRRTPVPISAMPMPDMIVRTSAKSRLMRPGTRIRSEMPCTACSSTVVGDLERLEQRRAAIDHGEQPLVRDRDERVHDVAQLRPCRPRPGACACLPSNVKGLVTTATVRMPSSLASDGDDGRGAGARAAAEAGGDEHHVRALEQPRDRLADPPAPRRARPRDRSRRPAPA